jgi:uncharacterized protein
MNNPLSFEEARVLGCLIEKQMATPDYYPLTPSALVAACNQTSNREPVVEWDETTVEAGAAGLRHRGMAAMVHMAGSRVPKFKHLLEEYFPTLGDAQRAILSVLLLRGPQSLAELRTRTERLYRFHDPEAVEAAMEKLLNHGEGPLAIHLPPGSGRRTSTYAHLLCGEAAARATVSPVTSSTIVPPPPDRLAALEAEVAELRGEVAELRVKLAELSSALGG